MFRKLSTLILFTSTLAIPAASHAACPAGQFYLDLQTCTTAAMAGVTFLPGGACTPALTSTACPAVAGWKQAALRIAIPAGCTQANVVVEYEGLPCGWTVNLGDSPTNDGFGGDAGSTVHNAEIQIKDENLSVYNASGNAALVSNLATAHLALTDSALKLVVKNQFISWGNPYTFMTSTAASSLLFAIPDPTVAAADQSAVYLGLNRVITGRPDRVGYGARRVLVTFK